MDELISSNGSFDSLHDDFVISEILSRVDSKSLVLLGIASKKFQSLCSYPPLLEFNEVPYDNLNLVFIEYIKKFFDSRAESSMEHEFRRFCMCLSEKTDLPILLDFTTVHLLGWFHKALSLNVQELILDFPGEAARSDIFLERPELMMNLQQCFTIPLKHLRVLSLIRIPIALNESFEDWISSCCVSLEELTLEDVLVLPTTLKITSSSLKVVDIDGDFEELHVVSAPKLEYLMVTWNLINYSRDESHPLVKISDAPNLQGFSLLNNDMSYNSLRYDSSPSSCGSGTKFPFLRYATFLLPDDEADSVISPSSLKRLLHDISEVKSLWVSDTILHQISREGMMHYAKLFRTLRGLCVSVKGDEESRWREKADTIISFAKNIPKLLNFKLIIVKDYYNLQAPLEWLQNALSLKVRELELQFEDNKNMNNYHYLEVPELNIPCRCTCRNLFVLTLKDIPIGLNKSFQKWVSTCCLNLQELNLSGVFVVPSELRLRSSSLKIFTIDAHFTNLHVISAPNLVTLHVTWNLLYHGTQETKLSLRVSDSPKLEDLLLSNNTTLPLEYYNNGVKV